MGRGGDLIDLTVLLLHAGAGLAGNRRRLVGGVAGRLDRALDLGNGRLQFVQEAVEPTGQLAQFVAFVVLQATGQVAFAAGDVLEHGRDTENRPRHAAGHQPDQQQADDGRQRAQAQLDQGAAGVAAVEFLLEGLGRAGQGAFRNVEQHAPGLAARDRGKRSQDLQALLVMDAVNGRAVGQQADHFGAFLGIDLVKALGQFAGIWAVAGQQAHGAEDAHLGLALVEVTAGLLAHGLQAVQVDVDGQGGDYLVGDHQREHDAGHQHLLAVDLIEVRFDHAGLAGGAWAH
ncbi:hypothetical protein D9M71_152710 [compost metagenome]